jgi:hypothetical protein
VQSSASTKLDDFLDLDDNCWGQRSQAQCSYHENARSDSKCSVVFTACRVLAQACSLARVSIQETIGVIGLVGRIVLTARGGNGITQPDSHHMVSFPILTSMDGRLVMETLRSCLRGNGIIQA